MLPKYYELYFNLVDLTDCNWYKVISAIVIEMKVQDTVCNNVYNNQYLKHFYQEKYEKSLTGNLSETYF